MSFCLLQIFQSSQYQSEQASPEETCLFNERHWTHRPGIYLEVGLIFFISFPTLWIYMGYLWIMNLYMTPITRSCEIFFLFQIDIMLQRGDFQFCHRTAQRDVYEPWPAFTCQPVIFSRSNTYFFYAFRNSMMTFLPPGLRFTRISYRVAWTVWRPPTTQSHYLSGVKTTNHALNRRPLGCAGKIALRLGSLFWASSEMSYHNRCHNKCVQRWVKRGQLTLINHQIVVKLEGLSVIFACGPLQ